MSVTLNKLNGAVDGLFERLLRRIYRGRYPLQPIYVERAVETAITNNTKVFKNGVLPPSNIEIMMNTEDYEDFKKIRDIYKKHVEETAMSFIESEFKGQTMGSTNLTIIFKEDPAIAKGSVTIRADHFEASYEGLK